MVTKVNRPSWMGVGLLCLLLAACGGGGASSSPTSNVQTGVDSTGLNTSGGDGGSGSNTGSSGGAGRVGTTADANDPPPIPPGSPGFLLASRSVVTYALPFSNYVPPTSVNVNFVNTTTATASVAMTWTGNAISSVRYTSTGTNTGRIDINYNVPPLLGPATIDDVVTITGCADSACATPIAGGPAKIVAEYTITNTIPGADGYTFGFAPLTAADLVWDAQRARLYASVPASASANANSVGIIDPSTGQVESVLSVGSAPDVLAISGDTQFLYVHLDGADTINRLRLPDLSLDLSIPLGVSSYNTPWHVRDMQVAPGAPHTIAVARIGPGSPSWGGLMVYDDATLRNSNPYYLGPGVDYLQFGADPLTLYGGDAQDSGAAIFTMTLASNGPQVLTISNAFSGGQGLGAIHYDNGLVYSDAGGVFDPSTNQKAGALVSPDQFIVSVTPDSSVGKIFALSWPSGIGDWYTLRSYDEKTLAPIASIQLSGVPLPIGARIKLVRWGADGLAFATQDGRIALIHGPFVGKSQ